MEHDHSAFYHWVAIIQMQYGNKNVEMQTMHTFYNKGSQTQDFIPNGFGQNYLELAHSRASPGIKHNENIASGRDAEGKM